MRKASRGYESVFRESARSARQSSIGATTQNLSVDIVRFLKAAYKSGSSVSSTYVMTIFDCSKDRALRVIARLVQDGVFVKVGLDQYQVHV